MRGYDGSYIGKMLVVLEIDEILSAYGCVFGNIGQRKGIIQSIRLIFLIPACIMLPFILLFYM